MKLFARALAVFTAGLLFASSAAYADDFGKRFGGKAPAALAEAPAPAAAQISSDGSAVQNIEPAGGEQAPATALPAQTPQGPQDSGQPSTGAGAVKSLSPPAAPAKP